MTGKAMTFATSSEMEPIYFERPFILRDSLKQIVDVKKVLEPVDAETNYSGEAVELSMYVNGPFVVQLGNFKDSRPFDTRSFPDSRHVAFSELKEDGLIFLSEEGEMIHH